MAKETFANRPSTTVTSGGTTTSDTSWTVASSTSFPAAATGVTQFHVADPALPGEMIAVTNVSGTTWTVTRGAEGSTAVAHSPGFTVDQVVTAGGLSSFIQNPMTSVGDIITGGTSGVPQRLGAGTSGQVLAIAAGTPTWQAASAGSLDWINITSSPYNCDPTGVADSAPGINAAITAAAPGQVVYFPQGTFLIKSPIIILTDGVTLQGDHGATASGDDSGLGLGTYIQVSSAFTNPTYSTYATGAVLAMQQPPAGGTGQSTEGVRIRDIWITGSGGAASVDGFAFYGSCKSLQLERCGVAACTGNSFAFYQAANGITSSPGGNAPDGIHMYSCVAQTGKGYGFYGVFTDAVLMDCHAQTCGSGAGQDGFYSTGGNTWLIGCRSDLNHGNGYTVDHRGGANGFQDTTKMIACGTQENYLHGLNVINSSSGGTTISMPVVVIGCDFGGDGQNGGSGGNYAGIAVQGQNELYISGTTVNVYADSNKYAPGCPKYGLLTQTPGVPNIIVVDGGVLNYAAVSGGTAILDSAGVGANLVVGPTTQIASGYAPSSFTTLQNVPFLGNPVSYAPGTQTPLAVNTTTMAAFSSANVNTGNFIAPPSGSVVVTASFVMAVSAASCFVAVGLANHPATGTVTMVGDSQQLEFSSTGQAYSSTLQFTVTGLTPWATYNFDLVGCCTTGDTATIYAYAQTTTTPTLGAGGRGGQVTMTVQAV